MMRAVVVDKAGGEVSVEEVTVRRPGPGEVLVEVDAAAVCITDVLAAEGLTLVQAPFIGGHSGTGIVAAVGEGVRRVAVGDRIVTAGSAECGHCYSCVRGTPAACDDIFGGMVPPIAVAQRRDGTWVHSEGGVGVFAEQAVLRESVLTAIPGDIEPAHAAMLGCGILSGVGAVLNIAEASPGSTVAIVGAGHLGLWMVQAAVRAGASRVIVIERLPRRRAIAQALGATHVADPEAADPVEFVREATAGRGADIALEAGGTLDGIETAPALARAGGTVVLTSMAWPGDKVAFAALDITVSGKRLLSSQSGGGHLRRDIPAYAGMLRKGTLDPAPILSRTFALTEVGQAFAAARGKEVITGVLLPQT